MLMVWNFPRSFFFFFAPESIMFISALIGQPRSDRQHQDIRFQIWCFSVIGFLSICRGQTGARVFQQIINNSPALSGRASAQLHPEALSCRLVSESERKMTPTWHANHFFQVWLQHGMSEKNTWFMTSDCFPAVLVLLNLLAQRTSFLLRCYEGVAVSSVMIIYQLLQTSSFIVCVQHFRSGQDAANCYSFF